MMMSQKRLSGFVFLFLLSSFPSDCFHGGHVRSVTGVSSVTNRQLLASETTWFFVPASYTLNDRVVPLTSTFQATLTSSSDLNSPVVSFQLKAVDTFTLVLHKQANGVFMLAKFQKVANGIGSSEQLAAQERVVGVLSQLSSFFVDGTKLWFHKNVQRLSFDQQLPTPSSPSVVTRHVVKETYMSGGQFQPLFIGAPFPIRVETQQTYNGFIKVALKGINTFNFDIKYNKNDGWVSSVTSTGSTQKYVTYEQMDAENKVKKLILSCQQLAFEKDNRLQFITDNGMSRISFDPVVTGSGYVPGSGEATGQVVTRFIKPDNFFVNGVLVPFHRDMKEVTLTTSSSAEGVLKVAVRGVSSYEFEIHYNAADGWVRHVIPRGKSLFQSESDQFSFEQRIASVVGKCQEIFFLRDGSIEFVADSGITRIVFGIKSDLPVSSAPTERRFVVTETYIQHGSFIPLFAGPSFIVTVDTTKLFKGYMKVVVAGINSFTYDIQYSDDGIVTHVKLVGETRNRVSDSQLETELKLKNIFSNVQQISFEKDGRIQFITDNGATRISFDLLK